MHPVILQDLASEHVRDMQLTATVAGRGRRGRRAPRGCPGGGGEKPPPPPPPPSPPPPPPPPPGAATRRWGSPPSRVRRPSGTPENSRP
jgi:hypothetical protein